MRPGVVLIWLAALAGANVGPAGAHADLHERIAAVSARIEQQPRDARLYLERGELHRLHAEWPAALADYAHARRLDPGLAEVDRCLGRMLLEAGQPAEARSALDRYLEAHPEHAGARLVRARALVALNRPLAAAEDYAQAITRTVQPGPELYLEHSQALAAAGPQHRAAALEALEQGLRRLGPLVVLQRQAIELELEQQRYDAALARLDVLLAQAARRERWLELRGTILERAGRPDEARAEYARALELIESLPAHRRRVAAVADLELRLRARLDRGRRR
jgi:tetratricopeptide (TPR) repeat protein